ncbi:uncharacterized protein LOC18437469 isoform X1 [Amborella trichopoda]|uniref:uncharacterized protein LOC18437469 isoform X1 n=2 Tax=Amborella trichopoda TaxID=13333 RepID=UPI0005D4228A|nr:uncharacterized protein LOC18437469 isoform X1 [Amborella trichopoda]|eukprot:XP_011624581.1 uncharacterized protein LOC18437469 isoform X1 [Amborella trichopoda]
MVRRNERSIKELYGLLPVISKPKITPVLQGNYRMQGPVDDSGSEIEANTVGAEAEEKKLVKHSLTDDTMHPSSLTPPVADKELKTEDISSDELYSGKAVRRHHVTGNNTFSLPKSRASNDGSETSNLASASSSHDSISQNGESKATVHRVDASVYNLADSGTKLPSCDRQAKENHLKEFTQNVDVSDANPLITNGSNNCAGPLPSKGNSQVDQTVDKPNNIVLEDASISSHPPVTCDIGSFTTDPCEQVSECLLRKPKDLKLPVSDINASKGSCSPSKVVPSSSSHSTDSAICSSGSKDSGENSSSQHKRGPSERSSLLLETSNVVAGGTNDKDGGIRGNSSSVATMKIHPCLDNEHDLGSELGPCAGSDSKEPQTKKTCLVQDEQVEKSSTSYEISNTKEAPQVSQPVSESEHSGSDLVEDDVKVCDICGDTGREDLLAICSRCSDGAEHTYCMQIMLDKLPEGEWLCEECKLKEQAENKKPNKIGTLLPTPKPVYSNEKSQNSRDPTSSKPSSKLNIKVPDQDTSKSSKLVPSPSLSSKRPSENSDTSSLSKRQALEGPSSGQRVSGLSKKPMLSRDGSSKNLEMGKTKPTHLLNSSGSQLGRSSQDNGKSHSPSGLNPSSPKVQSRLHSSRSKFTSLSRLPRDALRSNIGGIVSPGVHSSLVSKSPILSKSPDVKSSSLQSLKPKPKVKPVSVETPGKQVMTRDVSGNHSKKEEANKTLSKSASFKSGTNPNSSKIHAQAQSSSRADESRGTKLGKEGSFKRINSFKSNGSSNASISAGDKLSRPRVDLKNTSNSAVISLPPNSLNGSDLRSAESDEKSTTSTDVTVPVAGKGLEIATGSAGKGENGPTPSPSSNNIRCYKCKEMGHRALFCPENNRDGVNHSPNPPLSTLAEKKSKEIDGKGTSKWKHVVETAMSKQPKASENSRLPSRSQELSNPSNEGNNKDARSNSKPVNISGRTNFISPSEGTRDTQGILSSVPDHTKQNVPHYMDIPGTVPRVTAIPHGKSDGGQLSGLTILGKILAIPEHDYIWQGRFEVERGGRFSTSYDGIQAHVSSCASPKVLETVDQLPLRFKLEEVPRMSSWPAQFEEIHPTDDTIALYFFAKDVESYEKHYLKLLETMIKNDFALRGNIKGVELLIFTSNHLIEKSQRWNRLYFLWGVFRERKATCSESLDSSQRILAETDNSKVISSDNKASFQVLPSTLASDSEVPLSQRSSSCGQMDSERVSMGIPSSPQQRDAKFSSAQACSIDINSSVIENPDESTVDETLPSHGHSSTSIQKTQPLRSELADYSMTPFGMSPTQLGPEGKRINTSLWLQKEAYKDPESIKETRSHLCFQANVVQNGPVIGQAKPPMSGDILKPVNFPLGSCQGPVMDEDSGHGSRPDRKRPFPEAPFEASNENSDCKRLRTSYSDLYPGDKIGNPGFLNVEEPRQEYDYNYGETTERFFFPVDPGQVRECSTSGSNSWPLSMREDEGLPPDSDAPDLELALGAEKKPSNEGLWPLISRSPEKKIAPGKGPLMAEGEEDIASLSLSLSCPCSGEEKTTKPSSQTHQLLPERPRVNTSLLLFGGCSDT